MTFGISAATAAVVGGGLAAAGSIGSSLISSNAAGNAAQTQANAADQAAQTQWNMFNQLQQNLQPYMKLGSDSIPQLQTQLGNLGGMKFNFNPTEDQLSQTPGYQFTLQQGLKNTNNALAAKGLNLSGAQAKGIANYTTGLADNTYQQQYQNALQQFMANYNVNSDQYNRLAGLVGLGQSSAAGVGNAGVQTGANVGNLMTSGAAAQAAGTVGQANALSGGLSSLGSQGLLYSLMNNQNQGSSIYGSPTQGVAGWTAPGG